MASLIVDRGLQILVGRLSQTADAFNELRSMAVDDGTSAFVAGDTTLGSPANLQVNDFDATPTRSAQTVTHVATYAAGEANFEVQRISLHNDDAVNVTGASTTLFGGIDGQSITKTSDFTMTITVNVTVTDNS